MSELEYPTKVAARCGDCGATTTIEHEGGIGGVRTPGWSCQLCLEPLTFTPCEVTP